MNVTFFFPLNATVLKDNVKRKATFLFCKEQKSNFILFYFLEETHSLETDRLTLIFGSNNGGTLYSSVMGHLIELE